jgi:hypothetical protein
MWFRILLEYWRLFVTNDVMHRPPRRFASEMVAKAMKPMTANGIWKSMAAGLCGSAAHSGLMFLKSWMGWLPAFHPYEDLQQMLSHLIGGSVHPLVPWVLSFLNGAVVLGMLFGRIYRLLPGRSGAAKGFVFGVFGWLAMGVLFFPMLDRGLFATRVGLGLLPALFSLAMLLSYGIIMGIAYSALNRSGVVTSEG